MYRLLHLSDLHFGTDHHFAQSNNVQGLSTLAQAIKRALDENSLRVDHIVFTGDFFSHDQPRDRIHAEFGIKALVKSLELKSEDLSFLPGNHDKSWDKTLSPFPFIAYNELVAAFEHEEFSAENLPIIKHLNPQSKSRPILLALLNSCTVEGEALAGIGNVGEEQLDKLRSEIKKANFSNYVLIAALHHHLLPIYPVDKIIDPFWPDDAPKGRSSHTLDAIDVLGELAGLKTALIIHGHQHRPAVISYKDRLHKSPELTIAASGSCASKHDERQFYIHEINDNVINILSFTQDKNSNRFTLRKEIDVSVPLPHISEVSGRFCLEEAELRSLPGRVSESSGADSSDLHLLFLSVKDCQNSRNVIRQFVEELPPETKCTLHGMYDLLGRWDLLARLRFNLSLNFSTYETALYKKLLEAREMEKKGSDFSDHKHINITREARSFRELLEDHANVSSLSRKILGGTEVYDSKRCQRGLLYIKLPEEASRKNGLIQNLAVVLDQDNIFNSIVEGIYRGESDLVIEFFMTCAQSQSLNYINRAVEKTLSYYGVQKYTMFCYGYDEKEMIGG